MGEFKPMPKMATSEPSVILKLKKGGSVKKMNPGGMAAMPMRSQRVAPPALLRRKEGGEADMAQDKRLIKKAIKQHDAQEHKGGKGTNLKLRRGGSPAPTDAGGTVMGGLLGGISPTKTVPGKTSGVRAPGYKTGGLKKRAYKDGGNVAKYANTVVTEAKQTKSFNTKTGGVKSPGYKSGGKVSSYQNTMVHSGAKMPDISGKTGSVKQKPAGYKAGGKMKSC
jgi:hypothetical protein